MVVPPEETNFAGNVVSTGEVTGIAVAGRVETGAVDEAAYPALVPVLLRAVAGFLTISTIITAAAIANKPIIKTYISHRLIAGELPALTPLVASVVPVDVVSVLIEAAPVLLPVPYML